MRFVALALCLGSLSSAAERAAMVANFEDSASYRWLNKKVLESRLVDDMESLARWTVYTRASGGAVLDARASSQRSRPDENLSGIAEMTLTQERSRDGGQSLRFRTPTKLDRPGPESGRGWGSSGVARKIDGEDWTRFNRISLWVYPDCPGTYVISLGLSLRNEGGDNSIDSIGQGSGSTILRNHQWNHVIAEIGNVARDKVISVNISNGLSGNEPEEADTRTFYFDRLEVERVEPDYIEGWGVWPGRISFSHTGYQTGSSKTAIASGLNAREFRLVNQATGQTVLSKPVQRVKTRLGSFQVMDFSEVRQTGSYILEAGAASTRPFRIDPNVWRESLLKAINGLYAERCGMAIPGVHGVCHRDWQLVRGDKRIVMNGGWHDAGDLTQALSKTGEIVFGLFSLAERLQAAGGDPELYERVIDEAQWGLDWILKTTFHDGYRNAGSISSRKTNGILGDNDDIAKPPRRFPQNSFLASAAEAIAYRVLRERDPRLAAYALKIAEEDWRFGVEAMADPEMPWTGAANLQETFRVPFDSENVVHEAAATGALASIDLWRATGDKRYAGKAVELARIIVDSQERKRPNWDTPLTGFFYASPAKDRLLHYVHQGHEQGPDLALRALCEALPNHPEWMKWYSAVVLHSEYLKAIAKYTEPYGVMPASIYRDDEYLKVPESVRDLFQKEVLAGIPLGAGHYLRIFPAWTSYRGHFGTILPQAQALANAAHLRGDVDSAQVAQRQLEWVIGRNPFSQSGMWGEGYDFPPLGSFSSGDIVGGLPVGIESRGVSDVPYWPLQNAATYKEIWVHPMGRWIWLMRDLAGPAVIEGRAGATVEFQEAGNGQRIEVKPGANGRFRTTLPEGKYRVRCNGEEQTRVFLSGATYELDLRPGQALDFEVSKAGSGAGEVTIRLTARGTGKHRFGLRTGNLNLNGNEQEVTLRPGAAASLEWRARIASVDTPWVAVVVPDDDLSARKEVTGAAWQR